jgi:hypothetical protein
MSLKVVRRAAEHVPMTTQLLATVTVLGVETAQNQKLASSQHPQEQDVMNFSTIQLDHAPTEESKFSLAQILVSIMVRTIGETHISVSVS